MKQGDKVTTPDGLGIIIGIDLPESRAMRYVVRLDVSKYTFNPAYFPEEIRKASQKAAMCRRPSAAQRVTSVS